MQQESTKEKEYGQHVHDGVFSCCLHVLHSAIQCICGSRSSCHSPVNELKINTYIRGLCSTCCAINPTANFIAVTFSVLYVSDILFLCMEQDLSSIPFVYRITFLSNNKGVFWFSQETNKNKQMRHGKRKAILGQVKMWVSEQQKQG